MTLGALFRALLLFLVAADAIGVQRFLVVLHDLVLLFHLLVGLGNLAERRMAVAALLNRVAGFQLKRFTGIIVMAVALLLALILGVQLGSGDYQSASVWLVIGLVILYVTLTLCLSLILRWYERRIAIPGGV